MGASTISNRQGSTDHVEDFPQEDVSELEETLWNASIYEETPGMPLSWKWEKLCFMDALSRGRFPEEEGVYLLQKEP